MPKRDWAKSAARRVDRRVGNGMDPDLGRLTVTPREAAKMAGVDVSFVYAWVRAGELPHFFVGRAIKIPIEALRDFIRRRAGMPQSLQSTTSTRKD